MQQGGWGMYQLPHDRGRPGHGHRSINSNGDITLNDSLSYELDVAVPVNRECLSTPINMVFQSTAPYDTTTGDVTLSAANYTIPDFGGVPDGNPMRLPTPVA